MSGDISKKLETEITRDGVSSALRQCRLTCANLAVWMAAEMERDGNDISGPAALRAFSAVVLKGLQQ